MVVVAEAGELPVVGDPRAGAGRAEAGDGRVDGGGGSDGVTGDPCGDTKSSGRIHVGPASVGAPARSKYRSSRSDGRVAGHEPVHGIRNRVPGAAVT